MFMLLRILFLAVAVLLFAFKNRETDGIWLFGPHITLPISLVILISVFLGFLFNRWVEAFQQISLLEIIKEYSRKVTLLEKALADKEEQREGQPKG